MSDLVQAVCRLAVDVVSAKSEYVAVRSAAGAAQAACVLQGRIFALAEAFYAGEALYATNVCFRAREQENLQSARRHRMLAWQERSVYVRVARFLAGLGPTLLCAHERAGDALAGGDSPVARLSALSCALAKAGYLQERLQ